MSNIRWERKDENEANAEGWTLFPAEPGKDNFGIGKFPDSSIFKDDEEALKYVLSNARTFVTLALKAVHYLSFTNYRFAFLTGAGEFIRFTDEDDLLEYMGADDVAGIAEELPELGELMQDGDYPIIDCTKIKSDEHEYHTQQSFADKYGSYEDWRAATIAQSMLYYKKAEHEYA